jgi:hypothetical protein
MDLKTTVNGPLLPGNQGSDLAEFNIIKFVVFKHFLFIRLPANFFDNKDKKPILNLAEYSSDEEEEEEEEDETTTHQQISHPSLPSGNVVVSHPSLPSGRVVVSHPSLPSDSVVVRRPSLPSGSVVVSHPTG